MDSMHGILWSHGPLRTLEVMWKAKQKVFVFRQIWKCGMVLMRVEHMDILDMIYRGNR